MLASLISRELLNNLMTFRFAAAIFIILLLVVANTIVLINDYEGRLDSHNDSVNMHKRQLQEKKTYSAGNVHIDRPPNPLSIFNVGFDKQLGNEVRVAPVFVPSLWDAQNHGSSNPLMDMFASMDIAFIFEVILSLLALIFAYDAFAGEYETGTLRLVLTHPVRRGYYISCQIYQCNDLPNCSFNIESTPIAYFTDGIQPYQFKQPGFSSCWWHYPNVYNLSFHILFNRIIDFCGNSKDKYCADVVNFCLGFFSVSLSKHDSCYDRS